MNCRHLVVSILILVAFSSSGQSIKSYNTEKPWTYWWWMGSAVDEQNITVHLHSFAKAGFGGVHIIPIYGVKGYEDKFIPFLSEKWLSMLDFTIVEAAKSGLGVDLTMGTGWPFGGPQVSLADAAKRFSIDSGKVTSSPTNQMVKRAAPGGEGLVVDYLSKSAVTNYVAAFDSPLRKFSGRLRALYNDSYEVYGANWTNDFQAAFRQRRGYDLQEHLNDFLDSTGTVTGTLVRMDYHQTISELLHDGFTNTWTQWGKQHNFITRNQAHGSPGNLIDLYALADIPETESFGTSAFTIPGLRLDEHYEVDRFGTPDPLAMKFASSAANLTGKKLVSSETGTWLGDHFKVSLSQVKPQLDELFAAGINHVFYHGITYSPQEERFPGWLFYASTNFGLQSHVWKHISYLNSYVARCQNLLQHSLPDNDILIYFPIHDLWSTKAKGQGGIHQLDVHHTGQWLRFSAFGKLAAMLGDKGYQFDYVSDSLLSQLTVSKDKLLQSGASTYKVILVPPTEYIPVATLQVLSKLASAGVRIIFQNHLPKQPAGYRQIRSSVFTSTSKQLLNNKHVVVSEDIENTLNKSGVSKAGFSEKGLSFISRRQDISKWKFYFIANLNDRFERGWVAVTGNYGGYQKYDPLTDSYSQLLLRKGKAGQPEIFLELLPGQSCFLLPGEQTAPKLSTATPKRYTLPGKWNFEFLEGVPTISSSVSMDTPVSWTTFADSAIYFYGSGTYSLSFQLPDSISRQKELTLDLGAVCEVAEVTLNGKDVGAAWSLPYQLKIPAKVLQRDNTLKIRVSNLSANYMRLYDKLHPEWKKFYDINFVDIQYKPYDGASMKVMPSGLMGEVRLLYR